MGWKLVSSWPHCHDEDGSIGPCPVRKTEGTLEFEAEKNLIRGIGHTVAGEQG